MTSGKTKTIQKRYQGFLNTPNLWESTSVRNLEQLELDSSIRKINVDIDGNLRLGKYVERLASFQLSQQQHISIIAENIQIQKEKLTLGELDCLLLDNKKPTHLEIIYKFYMYDDNVGANEIEHCIGPNRRDSLIKKLDKLKNKQLPILYSDACKSYLDLLNLNAEDIVQKVLFKAQLFLPFSHQNTSLNILNTNCIVGYYIKQQELSAFKDCKFYVPTKKDWLIEPYANVKWLKYSEFSAIVLPQLMQSYASLFWLKCNNGTIKKMFLVWW